MATDATISSAEYGVNDDTHSVSRGGSSLFWGFKRVLDIVVSLLALPFVATVGLILAVLNSFMNKGPLFYRQKRMGKDMEPFIAVKFRSMRPAEQITRGADDPLELDRIPPLGHFLRRTRLDELPQFFNVLKGEMSLIGPRPDYIDHVEVYLAQIPEYRARHNVRPGITGLSQVTLGYIEGVEETRFKAQTDLVYIREANLWMDIKIIWLTIMLFVKFGGK